MLVYTNGFSNDKALIDHFTRHGPLLGINTEKEYEERADIFCGAPLDPAQTHIHECTRRGGDKIRYNQLTEEWGVLSSGNVIRTYYILSTALVKYGSGLTYYRLECAK